MLIEYIIVDNELKNIIKKNLRTSIKQTFSQLNMSYTPKEYKYLFNKCMQQMNTYLKTMCEPSQKVLSPLTAYSIPIMIDINKNNEIKLKHNMYTKIPYKKVEDFRSYFIEEIIIGCNILAMYSVLGFTNNIHRKHFNKKGK